MGLRSDPFSTLSRSSGDRFFDPESLSIVLPVVVPEFFEVTFDRFFLGPQNGPNLSKMVEKMF